MSAQTKVLVAEDEPDMLRGLERALSYEGYDVDAAGGGIEAAEKLRAKRFDVVVSDLRMPAVDGMDLLRIAKKNERDVVFIMITAYGTPDNAVEAMKLGSCDYLPKPFVPAELIAAIEKGIHARAPGSLRKGPAVGRPSAIFRSPDEHAWVSPQPDGTALVGADSRFFEEAGEVVFCDLPLEGDEIVKGQRCARTIDTTSLIRKPFRSPLSGTVIEVNDKMEHEPWETQRDPYGEAWLFRIAPSDLEQEVQLLILDKGP
jgi:DNA-binding response OmpR family regulator